MSEQRIGDAERERAAADLGEHFAQGRLSADEHEERLDQALRARTLADLTPLFRDLPGGAYGVQPVTSSPPYDTPRPWADGPPRAWHESRPRVPGLLLVLLLILLVVTVLLRVPFVLVGAVLWVGFFKHRSWHHGR